MKNNKIEFITPEIKQRLLKSSKISRINNNRIYINKGVLDFLKK